MTKEQFIEELNILNPEITVIGEYVNNKTKIEVKHTCGYEWKVRPNNLLQGSSCPTFFENGSTIGFISLVIFSNISVI